MPLRVSIHAPLARSNFREICRMWFFIKFQYMLLLRGATRKLCAGICEKEVSIHAPLARSNKAIKKPLFCRKVSIHAPLARSNNCPEYSFFISPVSIHAPLARSNVLDCNINLKRMSFNTCSSCEEQLDAFGDNIDGDFVSIHAPLARSNSHSDTWTLTRKPFQYMLLLRGATCC